MACNKVTETPHALCVKKVSITADEIELHHGTELIKNKEVSFPRGAINFN